MIALRRISAHSESIAYAGHVGLRCTGYLAPGPQGSQAVFAETAYIVLNKGATEHFQYA